MDRKPGKRVGSCVYVHRQYESQVIPEDVLENAKKLMKWEDINHNLSPCYDCVKWNKKTGAITFQWSNYTFDKWDEPEVGKCILVKDNTIRTLPRPKEQQIWHHKWMWVADDYTGFNVEESKARSRLWEPYVTKEEKRKIGYKSFWDSIKKRWEK